MTTRVSSALSSRTSLIPPPPVQHLFVGQLRDAFHQLRAIHVIGNLGDDDLLATALDLGHADPAAHAHTGLDRFPSIA